ncbi:hypothetical protein JW930_01860 [Candidatus Woesearchaeota archaeon]|nr:hypothetical protein [Candidatus Woesearchaeota archaeon]
MEISPDWLLDRLEDVVQSFIFVPRFGLRNNLITLYRGMYFVTAQDIDNIHEHGLYPSAYCPDYDPSGIVKFLMCLFHEVGYRNINTQSFAKKKNFGIALANSYWRQCLRHFKFSATDTDETYYNVLITTTIPRSRLSGLGLPTHGQEEIIFGALSPKEIEVQVITREGQLINYEVWDQDRHIGAYHANDLPEPTPRNLWKFSGWRGILYGLSALKSIPFFGAIYGGVGVRIPPGLLKKLKRGAATAYCAYPALLSRYPDIKTEPLTQIISTNEKTF